MGGAGPEEEAPKFFVGAASPPRCLLRLGRVARILVSGREAQEGLALIPSTPEVLVK